MRQYLDAVREILETGTRKENRTGVDTLSTFNINLKINLEQGFPLLTTKRVSWKNIVVENLWFLSGEPHIGLLQKHGCRFWDAWADEDGIVPSAYGNFWRRFPVHGEDIPSQVVAGKKPTIEELEAILNSEVDPPVTILPNGELTTVGPRKRTEFNDQIAWVVAELRRNPMSRRLVVSAWAPGNAQTSKLPPCHIVMVFNVQCSPQGQRLCLHLTQRSCDIALGVPYNIAGYAFLLCLVSALTGIRAGIFAHTLVDAHAYTCKPDGSMAEYDHVPGLREQLAREPRPLPRLCIDPNIRELKDINELLTAGTEEVMSKFLLEGYDPHPAIRFKVAV